MDFWDWHMLGIVTGFLTLASLYLDIWSKRRKLDGQLCTVRAMAALMGNREVDVPKGQVGEMILAPHEHVDIRVGGDYRGLISNCSSTQAHLIVIIP